MVYIVEDVMCLLFISYFISSNYMSDFFFNAGEVLYSFN